MKAVSSFKMSRVRNPAPQCNYTEDLNP